MMQKIINNEILELLRKEKQDIPDDKDLDLLKGRWLDSFGIARIAAMLEAYYNIEFSAEDIIPENFTSIRAIVKLVESHRKESCE